MSNLLFEVGVEEIPARFMARSLQDLRQGAEKALTEARLSYTSVESLGTPRRLTLLVRGLSEQQADLSEEIKGPAKKAAYDSEGKATKALQGFMRSKGLTEADLTVRPQGNGEYIFATIREPGVAAREVLPDILISLVNSLKFPKPCLLYTSRCV